MKNLKRILSSVIVMIMAISIASNTMFASAADYGTYQDGLKAAYHNYNLYATRVEGNHPNLDFEKGLEYWTTNDANVKPSEYAEIKKEENGNTYVTITAKQNYDCISAIKFTDPRIKVGDQLSIMIKWRGADKNFQPVLVQIKDNAQGKYVEYVRLADNGLVEQLKYPESEKDWGIILCTGLKSKVVEADKGDPTLLFGISLEVYGDLTISIDMDDVQIVKYNLANRKVISLDGKELYDLNAAAAEGAKFNSDVYGDFGIDFSKKYKAPKPDSTDGLVNLKNNANKNNVVEESGSKALLWVIIACCVLLIIAAAVFLIVVVKKKKAENPVESGEEDSAEALPETEETDTASEKTDTETEE